MILFKPLLLPCCAIAVFLGLFASPGRTQDQPNFVIIMADDLGYGDLSCYGGWIDTPHIDRLAASGIRFTDFHSNGAVCSPTRAALVTGRYQQRAGLPLVVSVRHRHLGLQQEETTFAESLGNAGYQTALCGKWHLGYQVKYNPVRHGFDRFRGYLSGNIDFFSHIDQSGVYDWWHDDELAEEEGYSTHLITRHALEFIDANRDQPFCLYVAHEAPHYPYQGPNDKAERTVGGKFVVSGARADKREAYREMVAEMDKGIGEMIDRLTHHDILENTLVIFLSDNGANQHGDNDPLRGRKGSVWEGGHRVPAIASWPGTIRPGTCDETLIGMDLFPTMLSLAGLEAPDNLDGTDLSHVLLKGDDLAARPLFWQHGDQFAMRDGPWKLVMRRRNNDREEVTLYDLSEDLGETTDLSDRYPDRAQAMRKSIDDWHEDVMKNATQQPAE